MPSILARDNVGLEEPAKAVAEAVTTISGSGPGPLPLPDWRQYYWGTSNNSGNAANLFDFDFDELSNLIEFGFGLDPTVSTSGDLVISIVGGIVVSRGLPIMTTETQGDNTKRYAVFSRLKDYIAQRLTYTPMFSPNLTAWQNSNETPLVVASDAVIDVVRVPFPSTIGGEPARFFQVEVTRDP